MSIFLKANKSVWPRFRALPKVLSGRESAILLILLFIFVASGFGLLMNYYWKHSVSVPAYGGQYREAFIGSPQYINPLFAEMNEVDRDLSVLVFSGLMKYDDNGSLKSDIAESYEILDSGKTYIFYLKKNVFWHDGKQLTADDVIFTINAFQNPEYKAPLSLNWRGVRMEKTDDFTVKFYLNNAFAPFLENLTIGILPKHVWGDISPVTSQISDYNLNPIGSGPYKFLKVRKDKEKTNKITEIELAANEDYYLGRPFIDKFIARFYADEEEAINALRRREVDGISYLSPANKDRVKSVNVYNLKVPRYFAVFFNQTKSRPLSDKNVRKALAYATNKKQIIDEALAGQADIVDSPILKDILGIENFTETYEFSLEKAREELSGWKDSNNDGILDKKFFKTDKDSTPLEITIYTSEWTELVNIAQILKQQWEAIGGVKINIESRNINDLTIKTIKPREFEALLFGEILYMDPDPFSFWHSSQKKDPGLNLAMYDNSEADRLLEQARQTLDYKERLKKYDSFQQMIALDVPAIFLFSPYYLYVADDIVKGIEVKNIATPARRFSNVEKWHIRTKRQFSY